MLVTLSMPLVVFMALNAYLIFLILLGENWLGAAPIFQALAPTAFVQTFGVATGWVYVTLGRTDRQRRWAIFQSIVIIMGFFVGLPFGPVGVAATYSIISVGLRLPAIMYCFRYTPLKVTDLLLAITPAVIAALGAAAGFLFLSKIIIPEHLGSLQQIVLSFF